MTDFDRKLGGRIAWLEHQLLKLAGLDGYEHYAERRKRTDEIDAKVRAIPDAKLNTKFDGAKLTMLGITTSCTAGTPGVYTNWINRARGILNEKLEELPE